MRLRALAASVLCVLAGAAGAATPDDLDFKNGFQLLAVCDVVPSRLGKTSEPTWQEMVETTACFSFLKGVISGIRFGSYESKTSLGRYCLSNVRNDQLGAVVVKYLRDNPADLHLDAASLAIEALRKTFPCKQ